VLLAELEPETGRQARVVRAQRRVRDVPEDLVPHELHAVAVRRARHLVRGAQVDLDRSVDHAEHALVELDRAGQDCLALGSELRAAIRPKYLVQGLREDGLVHRLQARRECAHVARAVEV